MTITTTTTIIKHEKISVEWNVNSQAHGLLSRAQQWSERRDAMTSA